MVSKGMEISNAIHGFGNGCGGETAGGVVKHGRSGMGDGIRALGDKVGLTYKF